MLPAKDTFMFHHVDGITGKSIIACHSINPDIFKLIGEAAPLIRESREQQKVIEGDRASAANNYWRKKSTEALRYGISTIPYLSSKNIILPERHDEYLKVLAKSAGSIEFTNLIKNAMVNAKKSIIYKVKSFFERNINIQNGIER